MTKQITLRLPEELHEALKKQANDMGISVHEVILMKINPIDIRFVSHISLK